MKINNKIKLFMMLGILFLILIFPFSWIPLVVFLYFYLKKSDDDNKLKNKRSILIILCILVCFVINIFVIFTPKINSIKMSSNVKEMNINSTYQINVDISPDTFFKDDIKFYSSNEDVAIVYKQADKFYIKSYEEGNAILKIISKNSKIQSNEINIKVIDENSKEKSEDVKEDVNYNNANDSSEEKTYVYISKSGSKYHSKADCSNMKNAEKITLKEAKEKGLAPCKRCY
ncbi:hypothetical protein [Anaerofustis sp. NSJ-163]|uniref:hypothetical protein n=1 Tax=Anaerofustis sp. NSJ-163 TaxID=2944391 RepID=UPI00209C3541|nr:hypothetical protein [Anaerofustis sp. NSJ-163]MCO8194487.1 hypothetical protein [Anaerofustis sp. NSJ-163]